MNGLPPVELWEDPEHEVQLGWEAHNLTREADARLRREEVVRGSLRVLLTLAARGGAPSRIREAISVSRSITSDSTP